MAFILHKEDCNFIKLAMHDETYLNVSCLPGVQFGELYYRFLELNRNQALQLSCGNFEAKTTLSHEARLEIIWWRNNVDSFF